MVSATPSQGMICSHVCVYTQECVHVCVVHTGNVYGMGLELKEGGVNYNSLRAKLFFAVILWET